MPQTLNEQIAKVSIDEKNNNRREFDAIISRSHNPLPADAKRLIELSKFFHYDEAFTKTMIDEHCQIHNLEEEKKALEGIVHSLHVHLNKVNALKHSLGLPLPKEELFKILEGGYALNFAASGLHNDYVRSRGYIYTRLGWSKDKTRTNNPWHDLFEDECYNLLPAIQMWLREKADENYHVIEVNTKEFKPIKKDIPIRPDPMLEDSPFETLPKEIEALQEEIEFLQKKIKTLPELPSQEDMEILELAVLAICLQHPDDFVGGGTIDLWLLTNQNTHKSISLTLNKQFTHKSAKYSKQIMKTLQDGARQKLREKRS